MKIRAAVEWALPYWTRGQAGRETPPELFKVLYYGWLLAFALKVLGSSWDVSWHFKWLRDDLAPPHLLNSAGTAIVLALTIIHGYTGYGVDRTALRLIQWGTGIFLVAVPLDLINHRVNGLDITSWSPSHIMLYLGTFFMIAGVIRGWYQGGGGKLVLAALFAYFLENILFPAQHQEYGVFAIAAWDRGTPEAEPILMQFAADQMGRAVDRDMMVAFSLPVPDFLYPVYFTVAGLIVLVVARMMVGRFGTATLVAAALVCYRAAIWPLLSVTGFPESAVPVFLVVAAVAVDVAFLVKMSYLRAVLGAALATIAVYGALVAQHALLAAPPLANYSAVWAAAGLAIAWLVMEWFVTRFGLRAADQPIGARVSATATP
ncbi:hypothetical protein GCM10010404_82230 [Nonomuraea africana]|uniref:DUF2029 domain-containing protein n=1 Tax=Nonomuraea africana TaxID=46171 RepID=A0ABR9K846_9ACTN|nr:hypothetical protein [Nonomuraea africana]MBE1558185.1 hypothetical protein [Nonomuraea africana]